MAEQWFVYKDGAQKGPFDKEQLKQEISKGVFLPSDLVWTQGLEQWISANKVLDLLAAKQPAPTAGMPAPTQDGFAPPQGQYAHHTGAPAAKKKSGIIVLIAVLAMFLLGGSLAAFFLQRDSNDSAGPSGLTASQAGSNPETALVEFYDAMGKGDMDRAAEFVGSDYRTEFESFKAELQDALAAGGDEADMTKQLFDVIFGQINLQTTGSTINGDTATVHYSYEFPDQAQLEEEIDDVISAIFENPDLDFDNMSDIELGMLFMEAALQKFSEVPKVTITKTAKLTREGELWKLGRDTLEILFEEHIFY